jgi:shikimate kinase
MNIILIGMRGSGKSTIGQLLADHLHKHFIEMDRVIELEQKKKIQDIVKESGWPKFRELESTLIEDLADVDQTIIATGGGAILEEKNRITLKKTGLLIWLTAPIADLVRRIGVDENRAMLTDASTMEEDLTRVFEERKEIYEQAADYTISTEGKSEEQVVEEIINILQTL